MGTADKERMRRWRIDSTKPQKHPGDTSSSHRSLLKPLSCPFPSNVGPVAKSSLSFFPKGHMAWGWGRRREWIWERKRKKSVCVLLGIVEGVTMRFIHSHSCGEGC